MTKTIRQVRRQKRRNLEKHDTSIIYTKLQVTVTNRQISFTGTLSPTTNEIGMTNNNVDNRYYDAAPLICWEHCIAKRICSWLDWCEVATLSIKNGNGHIAT